MFNRRSLFAYTRNTAVALGASSVAGLLGSRETSADEGDVSASADHSFQSMPFNNAPYPAPPVTFGKRSGVTVVVKTTDEMVQSLVPAPLKPVGPDLIIQQHRNTIAQPVLYHYPNANVIVPVMFGETSGFYMARVYEGSYDATTLTIWGREIWGFPKIAAETDAVREGNRASSYVRAGHATVSVALSLENTTQTEPAATLLLYCRKTIPSVDGQGLDLDRIVEVPWRHTPEERVPGEVKFCAVNLDLAGKSVKLPVTEYADAFWFTQEPGSILDKGKVVHDYLA